MVTPDSAAYAVLEQEDSELDEVSGSFPVIAYIVASYVVRTSILFAILSFKPARIIRGAYLLCLWWPEIYAQSLFVKCIKYSIYDIAHSLVHFQLTLLYTHFLYLPIFTIHSILSPYIAILSENVIVSYYAIPCAFTHAFLNVHRTTGIQVKVSMKFISKLLVSISSRLRETQFILRSCWGRDSLERCTGDGGIMGSAWWRWQ